MRFVVIIASVLFSFSAYASTLDQQASDLRAKCLRNFDGVKSAGFSISISASAPVKGTVAKSVSGDKVTFDRGAKKLKWKRGVGPGQAWVADATANTLKYVSVGASVIEESLDEQHALEMSTPSPRWLWHPEWLIPEKPVSVRDEGSALVLVASATHPKREIWLDKITGLIQRFTDTDAGGNLVRIVVVSGWSDHSGIQLPSTIDEELRGKKNTVHRYITLTVDSINSPLSESDFVLP